MNDEAEIVSLIYSLFLQGKAVLWIASYLTKEGTPTPRKKAKMDDHDNRVDPHQ